MMNNKMTIFWILACIGVIYLAIDLFGEGFSGGMIAAVVIFALTVMLVNKNKE